jgi:hypothetical protein
VGCPIRKPADWRLFASTRSLSQLVASFIVSESQGIRRLPLIIFCSYYIIQDFKERFLNYEKRVGNGIAPFQISKPTFQKELLKLTFHKRVEDIGVEPMTPCVQGKCSSQLS